MTQYIPKAAVVTEIERRISAYKNVTGEDRRTDALMSFKNFLDTIEVKEINFEDTKSVFDRQYLSKDKVVTTIERLQDECEEQGDNNGVELLEKLFNKLDTFGVKEVDLEKEIDDYMAKEWDGIEEDKHFYDMIKNDLKDVAKHFFELGMQQAQKL